MDNRAEYGFRWSTQWNGRDCPAGIPRIVASGTSFDVNGGAQNVGLGKGDPVKAMNTGAVDLAEGTESAGGVASAVTWGIVVGVEPYWDAAKGRMEFGSVLPDATVWAGFPDRQSRVLVVPVDAGVWEIDVDDTVTATTQAAYEALIGQNCDHILTGAVGATRAFPKLDISGTAVVATLIWRIVAVSRTRNNQDFAGANVKLLVQANVAALPAYNALGV